MPKYPKQNRIAAAKPEGPTGRAWVERELKTLDLGDPRREKRCRQMAADFYAQPGASIPQASGGAAGAKAAYRFLDNEAVTPAALLAAQRDATLARAGSEAVVLVVQDTTTLNFSTHPQTTGLGPISNNRDQTMGYLLHSSLCVREDGMALGLLDVQTWARDPAKFHAEPKGARNRKPLAEKESRKWVQSLEATAVAAQQQPAPLWVNLADREGDCYELFWYYQTQVVPRTDRVHLLVRCQHNRPLAADPTQALWAHVGQQPVLAEHTVVVPRQPGQPARPVHLALRTAQVTFAPPPDQRKYQGRTEAITLWVISAQEIDPPPGPAPLHWCLLTTLPVASAADARTQVQRYCRRWEIELLHKALKSGCRAEARQLETRARLERCLVLDLIAACRLLALSKVARGPDAAQPVSAWLAPYEWQALWCHTHRQTKPPDVPPSTADAVRWLAKLGGFLARKRDGFPGMTVLWRGLHRLNDLAALYRLFSTQGLVGNA